MAGFPLIQLPGYQATNALNFQPINDAIDSNRQNALAQRQMGLQEQRNALMVRQDDRAAQSHGYDMAARQREQDMATARRGAGIVQHIKGLPPEQQPAAWQYALKTEFKDLSPDLHDFSRAAPLILSKAAEYIGPQQRSQMDMQGAHAELYRAQAQKALREASDASGAYGKDIKIFQGPDGKIYGVQAGSRGELKYHDLSAPPGAPAPQAGPGGMLPQGDQSRQPLTPFRGVKQVGDELIDMATGRPVRSAGQAIQGESFIRKDAEAAVADIKSRNEAIQAARGKLPRLQMMADLIDRPDVYQGTGGGSVLEFKKAAQALGFDVEGVPAGEAVRMVANQFALALRNPAGGEGMPGALSDRDLSFLVSSVPGLTNTRGGNKIMVRTMIDMERYKIAENAEAARYLQKNRSTAGLAEHMQAWSERTPALSKETRDLITGVTGIQYGVRSGPASGPTVPDKMGGRVGDPPPSTQGRSFAAPQIGSGPTAIRGDDDYNALPSGTEFIGPDGKRRRKP